MIPAIAHFIWFGTDFPFVYGLALRSAARRGEFDRVILHHADPVADTPGGRLALATPGIELRTLAAEALLEDAGPEGGRRADLYRRLATPAARTNVVRAALLFREGGVYLDTDTATVASLRPLLADGVFCGVERLAYPAGVAQSSHFWTRTAARTRSTVRSLFRVLPNGHRWFERIAYLYPTAANNAVLGAAPGHPLVGELLERMLALSPSRQLDRYALGTHLLQELVQSYRGTDLRVYAPPVFYPLGPEIAEHWFRIRRRVRLEHVVRPETRVIHWYASNRTADVIRRVEPAYIRANEQHQLFSKLVAPLLD